MRVFFGCFVRISGMRDGSGRVLVFMKKNLGVFGIRDFGLLVVIYCYFLGVEYMVFYSSFVFSLGFFIMFFGVF